MEHHYPTVSRFCTKFILLLAFFGLVQPSALRAQTYSLPTSGATTVTTCTGTLYDDGGASSSYSPYANGSTTIVPATPGSKVRLQFTNVAVEVGYDLIYVYDGSNVSAPLIGSYDSNNLPGTLYGSSASGALTVRMTSDGVVQYSGFEATIGCVTTIPPQAQADLAIQGASLSPLSVVAGGLLYATSSIYNLSGATANSSSVGYYLSTNATLDAADQLLGNSQGFALQVGQSSSRYGNFNIPIGTAPGNYFILFAADYLNQVPETNENNNVAVVSITVTPPSIDLSIQQASVNPTNTAAGNPVGMNCSIANQGNAAASSSSVGFYFSTNTTLDAADQLLTSQYGGQLFPGGFSPRFGTAGIPPGTPSGTYYILFVADYQNQVSETNEGNNVVAVSITVSPPGVDLVISQEQLFPSTTVAGNSVQANCAILNQGNIQASSSTTGFYLSTDQVFDASDVLLSTVPGPPLGANQSLYRAVYPIIPAATTPGAYYVLFVADPQGNVTEVNETNNVRSLALTVTMPSIDLQVQSTFLSPTSVAAGGATSASCYLYNQGNAVANPATVGYYLSTNLQLDASDVLLANNTGSVFGGGYSSRFANLTVPVGTPTGTYYVLFVADYLNQIGETNENNNVASAVLQVVAPSVDLTMLQPYVNPFSVAPGSNVNASAYIQNIGNTSASSSTVGYYLSANQLLDASDVVLATVQGGALSGGVSSSRFSFPVIPVGTVPGSYYVLFVADPQNVVVETNENNNVTSAALVVVAPGIDLLIQQQGLAATSVTPGFSVGANCSIRNIGNAPAASSSVGFYLSTDQVLGTSDVLLSTLAGPSLQAGGISSRSDNLTVPVGTAPGNYFVLFVADPQNAVIETNEGNNVAATPLTVLGPFTGTVVPTSGVATVTTCSATIFDNGGYGNYADNSFGSLTIMPATAGSLVQLSFTSFSVESGYDYVRVYDGITTNASLLGTYTGNQIPLPLVATNSAGALTVQFTSDGVYNQSGFEATVSCTAAPLSDLLLTQIGASPSSVPTGGALSLSATVANQGGGAAASSPVGYYLSTNQVLDAADRLLGTSAGALLAAGDSDNRQLTVAVPTNVAIGAYYVLFVADPQNAVAESNETNNIASLPVTITQGLASREQTAGYAVAVAPNPVAGGQALRVQFTGVGAACTGSADLYNALGQRVSSQVLSLGRGLANQTLVPTQALATGVYTLRLTGTGLNVTRRVVIE